MRFLPIRVTSLDFSLCGSLILSEMASHTLHCTAHIYTNTFFLIFSVIQRDVILLERLTRNPNFSFVHLSEPHISGSRSLHRERPGHDCHSAPWSFSHFPAHTCSHSSAHQTELLVLILEFSYLNKLMYCGP